MTIPLDDANAGGLAIIGGISHLTMRADDALAALCQAHFEGLLPNVSAHGGRVEIVYPRFWPAGWLRFALQAGRHAAHLTLSARVPWTISLRGGVAHLDADLRQVRLSAVEVHGGMSHVDLALGQPSGLVTLRLRGGSSNLTLTRPVGVPVRLIIRGGASRLEFDAMHFGAIGGGFDWQSPDYATAPDKYEIEIGGGASRLTIAGE
jgi:hypothetical protein